MSKEEIIMLLSRFTCPTIHFKKDKINVQDGFGFDMGYFSAIEIQKAIQELLVLYNKEIENNKLTANDNHNFEMKAYMLGRKDENEAMKGVIANYYIGKNKIKEAIENSVCSYDCLKEKIEILLYGEEYFK